MDSTRVPASLRERLGTEATAGLVDLFNDAQAEWRMDVIAAATDRYERRLVEEASKLWLEMAQGFASIRQELHEAIAGVRQDLRQELRDAVGAVRHDLGGEIAGLRGEIVALRQEIVALRQEIAKDRFELLKWAFVFWVGQFFALAGMMAVLIRLLRP